ncbi:hypothetical protein BpHYR1_017487 [Brachionus plicatilis]|uniref:Uncharacterized protein n=1 Tax=Brachionus plicatilis TaxID=10195 RepID=A0A3M7QNU5_BRAPC|nr:hypothetical protein BpHYR1_017487 [Brachionus plicatilis]
MVLISYIRERNRHRWRKQCGDKGYVGLDTQILLMFFLELNISPFKYNRTLAGNRHFRDISVKLVCFRLNRLCSSRKKDETKWFNSAIPFICP